MTKYPYGTDRVSIEGKIEGRHDVGKVLAQHDQSIDAIWMIKEVLRLYEVLRQPVLV